MTRIYESSACAGIYAGTGPDTRAARCVEDILTTSYRIFLGRAGETFIHKSLQACWGKTEPRDVDRIFADRRAVASELEIPLFLSQYKVSSIRRTAFFAGSENFRGRVLDFGCGTNSFGHWLLANIPEVHQVMGVDITQPHSSNIPGLDFTLVSGDTLPFGPEFDVAVARFSLHHIQKIQQERVLHSIYDSLKPGGTFILIEDILVDDYQLGRALFDNSLFRYYSELHRDDQLLTLSLLDASSAFVTTDVMPFPCSFRSIIEWKTMLNDTGFVPTSSLTLGLPWTSLYQAPGGIVVGKKD